MYLQLWPAGGARELVVETYKYFWVFKRQSRMWIWTVFQDNLTRFWAGAEFQRFSVNPFFQKFDWLSRPNDTTYQKTEWDSCEGPSKDAMFRNRAKLDKNCGRRSILSVLKNSENFLKLWPLGGARGFELGTWNFICVVMVTSGMSL